MNIGCDTMSNQLDIKASEAFNYLLNNLYDYEFYSADIDYEYSPLEESVKSYCDKYITKYLELGKTDKVFDNLKTIMEALLEIEMDTDFDNLFRPVELLTYYFGKLITASDGAMKNRVYTWMYSFVEENEECSLIVDDYLKPFMEGIKIYHADEYYTDYDDYDEIVQIYKSS